MSSIAVIDRSQHEVYFNCLKRDACREELNSSIQSLIIAIH